MAKIIDGKAISAQIRTEIKAETDELSKLPSEVSAWLIFLEKEMLEAKSSNTANTIQHSTQA